MELPSLLHRIKTKKQKTQAKMKYFYLIVLNIFLLLHTTTVKADYSPTPLNYMILEADLAVYGEIDSMADKYFFLKIKNKVFGNYNDTAIKVKKFQDWRCAVRWTKYEVGQKVFLFLQKDENKDWSIMSGGGEGELPIVEDTIYIYSYYSTYMPFPKNYEVYKIYGAKFSGLELNLNQFSEAVAGIRACFRLTKGKMRVDDKIELMCTSEKLDIYKSKSKLNNWMAETCMPL